MATETSANKLHPRMTQQEYHEKFIRTCAREKIEHDGVWNQHVALFQELGQLGITGILEEITQEKFNLEEVDGKMMYHFDRPWEERWWEEEGYKESEDYQN